MGFGPTVRFWGSLGIVEPRTRVRRMSIFILERENYTILNASVITCKRRAVVDVSIFR